MIKSKRNVYKIRKTDIVLCIVVILFSLVTYFFLFKPSEKPEKGIVVVTIDGKEYNRYPLGKDQNITIQGNGGMNCLQIKNSKVKMVKADCPDEYCVMQKEISKKGQSIICLPHKLSVEILEQDTEMQTTDNDVDAIVK